MVCERVGLRRVLVLLVAVLTAVSAGAQTPLAVNSLELNQHVLRSAPVEYPAAAKAQHISGTVVLLVQVSAAGKVTQAQSLQGPVLLRPAAQKSVEQWVFQPFEKDGHAVAAAGLVKIIFDLGGPLSAVQTYLSKVRTKYAIEPGLGLEGFSCRVEPVWREFPPLQNVPADSPFMQRLERTRMRLVVAAAAAPLIEVDKPKNPALNLSQLTEADQVVAATRQMVKGFYMTWQLFGITGPSAPSDATMKTTAAGTVVEFRSGGVTDWLSFDASSRMTHFTQLMPTGETIEESPQFAASSGRLLYTGSNFEIHQGASTAHGAYNVEYQQVDGYRMPRTVEIKADGGLDVHLRFTDCKVGK